MYVNCREELLATVIALVKEKGVNEFTVVEVVESMQKNNTIYKESTIRTHITSRCCFNAPKHHASIYDDYERINKGVYRIKDYD